MTKVFGTLLALTIVAAVIALGWMALPTSPDVVVYTSADDQYSRPLVAAFENESGLKVGLVTDAEAAKTTGLYQRLLAEQKAPRADVFWNNEISRTLLLSGKGAIQKWTPSDLKGIPGEFRDPEGKWYGLACRVRVIIYNKEKVSERDAPGSVFDLAKERWKDRAAMAYPLFGTSATHCAALRAHPKMGREKANRFFRELVRNGMRVVEGNSVVAKMVGRGTVEVGLTDTDDAWNVIAAGMPVGIVYPDQRPPEFGALVIPNTATMISGCRRPAAARKFLDFLLSAKSEAMLAAPPARHLPVRQGVKADKDARPLYMIRPMEVDWGKVAAEVEKQAKDLEDIFPR